MAAIDVRMQVEKLTVLGENEGSPDEPYLWVVYVKVDGTTLTVTDLAHSGAKVFAPAGSHGDLGSSSDDMEAGDSVAVPGAIGRLDTTLFTVDGVPDPLDKSLAAAAIVLVALEEDATKDSAAEAGRKALVAKLQKELDKAIRAGVKPNIDNITKEVEQAVVKAVKDASVSVLSFMPITSLLDLGGIVDPDDFVGSGVAGPFTFQQIRDAGLGGIPFTVNLNGKGEGSYQVKGKVMRRPWTPFTAFFTPGKGGQHFVAGVDFKALVDLWNKLAKQNPPVDMVSVENYVEGGVRKFAAIFSPGKGGQHFVAGVDFKALVDLWNKLAKQNPPVDMVDVETYEEGGSRKFAAIFSPGKGGQHFVAGVDFKALVDLWNKLAKQNPPVDMVDVETYEEGGSRKFAAIFSPGKGGQHFVAGVDFKALVDLWNKLAKQNPPVDMVDVETYMEGGGRKNAAIFSPGKGGQHLVSGVDFDSLIELWNKLAKQNPPVDMIDVEVG